MQYPRFSPRPITFLCVALLLVCGIPTASLAGEPFADLEIDESLVIWHSRIAAEDYRLLVSGPGGVFRAEFDDPPTLAITGAKGNPLPDGDYSYELWAQSSNEARFQWGYLTVSGGNFVRPQPPNSSESTNVDKALLETNLYVTAQTCLGVECVNHEVLNDTLLLKQNSPVSIGFEDTNIGTGEPNWKLSINDQINKVSWVDVDNNTTPFTLEAAAPDHAFYVDSTGNVGFGTLSPQTNLNISSASVPAVRLEYINMGNPLSKWDLSGDDSAFTISDVTGTATKPFSIAAGAPSDALTIDAVGEVGVGTDSPDVELHVVGSMRISETDTGDSINAAMLTIAKDGDLGARIRFDDGNKWNIGGGAMNTFFMSDAGDTAEFILDGDGNLSLKGSLDVGLDITAFGSITASSFIELSDVNAKENFATIDSRKILATATGLPITTWSYKDDKTKSRHLGPMAQDFHAAFGLGDSDQGIAPRNLAAVTLAALQGLNQVVEDVEKQNAKLRQQNAELLERLEILESALLQGAVNR